MGSKRGSSHVIKGANFSSGTLQKLGQVTERMELMVMIVIVLE